MIRLLVLGLVFTLWSLAVGAPMNNTVHTKGGIVFPKKIKINATEKTEDPKTTPKEQTTLSPSTISTTDPTSESSNSSTATYVHLTVDEEYAKAESIPTEHEDPVPEVPEDPEAVPEESSPQESQEPQDPQEPVDSTDSAPDVSQPPEVPLPPDVSLPPDANDGLIEYNLGNPLALRLHLPWWPLKDMLRSIQDAISVMNLTMTSGTVEADSTKTRIVQFDDRNYTLKVRVFKPHENNRLLVRLISLTPVIEEGKTPTEKGVTVEDEQNETLDESENTPFSQVSKMNDEKELEEKRDDDDDDDDKKGEKKKAKDSKKDKQSKKKKKKEEEKESDSEKSSD